MVEMLPCQLDSHWQLDSKYNISKKNEETWKYQIVFQQSNHKQGGKRSKTMLAPTCFVASNSNSTKQKSMAVPTYG